MAQTTTVCYVDDIDGTEADGSVMFALDGTAYEIDLSAANAKELRGALAGFIESARKLGKVQLSEGGKTRSASSASTPEERAERERIRAWAQKEGLKVGDRGRISAKVMAAYHSG